MYSRPPPLDQIQAFIEAAHGPNFRAAAERCAISPAAFTRRLQAFASSLAVTLFERTGDGLRLTAAGKRCLAELEPAYLELRRATAAAIRGDQTEKTVRISLSHSLAVGWLIPRLNDLHRAAPEIELTFETVSDLSLLRRGQVDMALCSSDHDLTGLIHLPLLDISITPVASPGLISTGRALDLAAHPRLALSRPPDVWDWWTRQAARRILPATVTFDVLQAMYEAASQGLGIALAASPTVQPYLDDGRLVELGLPWLRYPRDYRLVTTTAGRRRPATAAVHAWLEQQGRQTPDRVGSSANASRSRSASR